MVQFNCPFINPKTGAESVVVVALTAEEIADVEHQSTHRGLPPDLDHPLATAYAYHRAVRSIPDGFTELDLAINKIARRPAVH